MNKRSGVVVGVVAIVVALAVWWWRGSSSEGGSAGSSGAGAAGGAQLAGSGSAGRRLVDPSTVARGALAGAVTDATTRAPIAGALVCAEGSSSELPDEALRDPVCAATDASGRYQLSNLLPASYAVGASARTYRPELHHPGGDRRSTRIALAAGQQRTGVDIALRPGGVELTGTVADLTGGPIARARVRAATVVSQRRALAETDDQGRFSLWVAPGEVWVTAGAEGYADSSELGRAPGKLDLLLTPESALAGTVVDAATGHGVEGVRVVVAGADLALGVTISLNGDASAISGPTGAFRVTRLTPGRYVATARGERGYGRTEGSVLVGLGQHVDGVVVKLFPARRVEGRVIVAATRRPCERAHVELADDDRAQRVPMRAAGDGTHFADGVLPGSYQVRVRCGDHVARDPYPAIAVAGSDVTDRVWEVDAGATLRGRVVTRTGDPVDGAELWARMTGGAARAGSSWASDTSAHDGGYELRGLKPGSYLVEVTSSRGAAPADGFAVELASGAVVERDLVLDDAGAITGVVVDSAGKPVAGATLVAQAAGSTGWLFSDGRKSDDAGAFTLDGLRPAATG